MGMEAAGAYISQFREHLGWNRANLASKVGTSSSQIKRIEEGGGNTRAVLLAAMARAVGADANDVIDLLISNLTADDGKKLAEERIQSKQQDQPHRPIHPEILSILQKLSDYELGKWVAVGERLLLERNNQ